jgi:acetyltransferase-like isoleucine patch superfamily enzyme
MIREENTIADGVRIGTSSVIEHHVRIHKNVHIHSRAFIPEYSILHEGCWIGPAAVLTNTPHPLCPKAKECLRRGVIVKKYAKIGANATLLPHISIGEYCVVGSGAVVTKDVPAGKVVAGNPARIIKSLSQLKCHYDKNRRPYDEDPAC